MTSQQHQRPSHDGNICHVLPCSISEDGTAPVAQYFHPTPVHQFSHSTSVDSNSADADQTAPSNSKTNVTIMGAQFRGRGLLCAVDGPSEVATESSSDESASSSSPPSAATSFPVLSTLPPTMLGVALGASTLSSHQTASGVNAKTRPLKVIETFNKMYNWQHEHDLNKITRDSIYGSDKKNDKFGLNAALAWCDVSHAIHDPIPVPP